MYIQLLVLDHLITDTVLYTNNTNLWKIIMFELLVCNPMIEILDNLNTNGVMRDKVYKSATQVKLNRSYPSWQSNYFLLPSSASQIKIGGDKHAGPVKPFTHPAISNGEF